MVQDIFPVVGDVKIFETIIVIVADAHPLAPSCVCEPRLFRYVGEGAVMIIAVEMVRRCFARGETFQLRAVHDENVGPAIIVVIKNRNAGAGGFENVFFRAFAAEYYRSGEARFCRDVREMRDGRRRFGLGRGGVLSRGFADVQGEPGAEP